MVEIDKRFKKLNSIKEDENLSKDFNAKIHRDFKFIKSKRHLLSMEEYGWFLCFLMDVIKKGIEIYKIEAITEVIDHKNIMQC